MKTVFVALFALCSQSIVAFSPNAVTSQTSKTALHAESRDGVEVKNVALSGIAAALIASAVLSPTDALAFSSYSTANTDFGSTSELLAARSGGRAGGRSMGRSSMRSSPRPVSRTVVAPGSTTYIRPASNTVIMGSPFGYSPFGYNPFGGFGMGYGLGAANSIGSEIRDSSQDRQLADERAELAAAQTREAQLEQRIKALEAQGSSAPPMAPATAALQ